MTWLLIPDADRPKARRVLSRIDAILGYPRTLAESEITRIGPASQSVPAPYTETQTIVMRHATDAGVTALRGALAIYIDDVVDALRERHVEIGGVRRARTGGVMDKDSINKIIDGVKLLALCGLAVLSYSLGAQDLAVFIAGGAFGHVVPQGNRRVTPVMTAAAFFVGASVLTGCGASDAVRARYSVEVAQCIANERAIVDRQGTTEEQDRADLAAERERCDEALRTIEEGE